MLASAVIAPAVGAFDTVVKSGTRGEWTIPDYAGTPGAVCRYENNPGKFKDETNKVSSRKIWTHGPWATKSWVGHRVIVMKRKNGASRWKRAWKSSIIKKKANDTAVAFFGGRHFRTPEKHAKQYRVVHQLTWYQQGSKTKVAGKLRGAVEIHKHVLTGQPPYTKGLEGGPHGWCSKRFWPVPV
jgi:hypothetical protein